MLYALLASLLDAATEKWNVENEDYYDERGRVYLDLADARPAEIARGMALLKRLVG